MSKCPSLTPILENPFEREYSLHCEREALKEMKKSNDNVLLPSKGNDVVKKPKAESPFCRPCDDSCDILPAAKRPRKSNASQRAEDGSELAKSGARSGSVTCLRN